MDLLEILDGAAWVVIGLAGAWLLVTGRKMVYGLPRDIREGGRLRVFGLATVALAAFVISQFLQRRSFSPAGAIAIGLFLAITLALSINRRSKGASGGRAGAGRVGQPAEAGVSLGWFFGARRVRAVTCVLGTGKGALGCGLGGFHVGWLGDLCKLGLDRRTFVG